MARRRRSRSRFKNPYQAPVTHFKTYVMIFMLCGLSAVVLDFLFGVPEKARQFAQESVNSAVQTAVRSEVASAAKQSGASKEQLAALAAAQR